MKRRGESLVGDSGAAIRLLDALPKEDGKLRLRRLTNADKEKAFQQRPGWGAADEKSDGITEAIAAFLVGRFSGQHVILTAISDVHTDSLAGCMVFFNITAHEAEIGYWVMPPLRGRGTATAAVRLALDVARAAKIRSIVAHADDAVSAHMLCRAGFLHDDEEKGQTAAYRIILDPNPEP